MRITLNDGPARCGAVLFLGLGAVIASVAEAQELMIDAKPCSERIRVHARDVPLGDVVGRLSEAMGVRLVAKVELPEPVSVEMAGAPEDVVKRLLHGKNLVTESKAVATCGRREVLATIWLLPAGEQAARPAAADQPRIEKAGEQPEFRSYDRNQGKARATRKAGRPRAADEEGALEAAPEP